MKSRFDIGKTAVAIVAAVALSGCAIPVPEPEAEEIIVLAPAAEVLNPGAVAPPPAVEPPPATCLTCGRSTGGGGWGG